MRYLLIKIFIVLLVSSCSIAATKGLVQNVPEKDYVVNDFFSDIEKDYIYKAKLQILKHHFGGILIIKKIKKNHHRIVFTTEFGNKLFDLEIIDDEFRVNYIFDKLNKKFILIMLQHDFQTLISQNNKVDAQFSSEQEDTFQSNTDKYQNYYVFSKQTHGLTKIISASKNKEKLLITFLEAESGISSSIRLNHKQFKARLHLNYIGKKD